MSQYHTEHSITIAAPAEVVHRALRAVADWPNVFPPTIHAEVIEQDAAGDHIRLWATANESLKTWTSRRSFEGRRISFRQVVSAPPVASMSGVWEVEEIDASRSRVVLSHSFSPDGSAGAREWIEAAIETNSTRELESLKSAAEALSRQPEAHFTFEDSLWIDAEPSRVREFIDRADLWAERLAHVDAVTLTEPVPGHQFLSLDTRTPDGDVHTTASWRVALESGDIVYKQTRLPGLLSLHRGRWSFAPSDGGTLATSEHTVTLITEAIPAILGADKTLADAREFIRNALGRNSSATLEYAKEWAEKADRSSDVRA
ncbi:aromatase/cyclase [Nocardia concava]|uniref:aromatase/cyclase n=1 Tax=Nocardia concava TaxID=257281 RepID=UPI00030A88AD|nr:aromatase/cyclase [Nocardia concava]